MTGRAARGRFLIGLVFALLAEPLSAQQSPPQLGLETVVRHFYSAYASGDLDSLLALWEPGSPSLAAFREEVAPILRVRCMTLHDVTIDSIGIEGQRAAVDVHIVLSKRSQLMPERYDPHSATFELVHGARGWRVAKWTLREEAFAGRLLAARSDAERQALLRGEPRLLTPALDRSLCSRGVLALNQQRFDDATTLMDLARQVASRIGDPAGLSLATGIDSILHRLLPARDLKASLELARESFRLAEESSDPDVIARAALRLGKTLYSLERPDEALPWFERAYSFRDELEDDSVSSLIAGQIAQVYSNRGDHHASMHYSEVAAATARDDFARAGAEMNLGGEYALGVGDYRLAIPHLARSVELARRAGYRNGVPEAGWLLARCYLEIGQKDAALRVINDAFTDLGPASRAEWAQSLLIIRSRYHVAAGRLDRAEADLLEAVRAARVGEGNDTADPALSDLASLRLRQRRYTEAGAIAAGVVSRAKGFAPGPLLMEARAERHLGRRDAAYRILRRLIEAAEETSASMQTDERQRQGFFESRAGAYVELADMLVQDRRFAEALIVAERSKGRLLLDILRDGKLLQYSTLTNAEREEEAVLERRVSSLNMQSVASPANEERVAEPLREARRQLEDYRAELCSKYPRLVQHATPSPLTLHATSALLPDSSAAFVEYFVTETRLVIFVVTRGRGSALHVHTIPVSRRRLEVETGALVQELAERDLRFGDRSRRLYDLVLAPIARELEGVKTVAIIPDGPLWQLPFESLVMPDGRFVIERLACFYAPSISVYREMVRRDRPRPSGNFLAFANPLLRRGEEVVDAKLRDSEAGPLPDAEREVQRIAGFFRDGTCLYVGPDALESRVKSESSSYDVIHFATHGVLDDNNPMYSHLLLATSPDDPADDGFLETWELMRLDLHAELTVLSACDTARGTVHAGEGLIGMSWALFVAGCSSTVATQWKVPSATAADLMIDFYRQWLRARRDTWFAKAEALRLARLHLLRDGKHRDPLYWSGYVLVGSGR